MLDQIDETKKGLYTVVAKEIRDFLQTTNFAGDVKKILTGLGAHNFVARGDGRHVFLSNRMANSISMIDQQTLEIRPAASP